ncbi:1,5-anhydro-D-fructose reductase-like isoform X3 [Homalodisca vitripennis]|uniref:1,5-anhydro-D-fructose reductase-like isoform X3 n=2 Tax=Homalodisca vitripennis TaxID=197043 RepID=UPI001EEAA5E3|nr:1,5-anhydro-D-fructose reductase-like isoform X3 [Homalodisca vitripennis]
MSSKVEKNSFISAHGMKMPIIGLGTWQASEEEVETSIDAALEAGYRHIDTAFVYMNEKAIGKALKKWFDSGKIKREDLFIVTKLPNVGMNEKYVGKYLDQSLSDLQLSYVDLYLIHHPVGLAPGEDLLPRDGDGNIKVDLNTDHVAIWKALEKQVDAGRIKAIGVSNFNSSQIDRILKAARIPPANNQVELHVYLQQKKLQEWSKKTGVTLCAYAPLGSRNMSNYIKKFGATAESGSGLDPLSDPVVLHIAQTHNKTAAQVLLRHLMQLGIAVIPKSTNPDRIRQNFEVFDFELSETEMDELNGLDKGEEGRKFVGGIFKGIEHHPEYPFGNK